jgi:hypothetical protein
MDSLGNASYLLFMLASKSEAEEILVDLSTEAARMQSDCLSRCFLAKLDLLIFLYV